MGNLPFCVSGARDAAGMVEPTHQCEFPMYVVKVSDYLQMEGSPRPHHELLDRGLLHQWQPGMYVIFVSHQWLGRTHPDPDGKHAAVLRSALKGMVDGSVQVEPELHDDSKPEPIDGAKILGGYLFLDWFAIPQITARAPGVNEEVTKSDAARAVQSIPFYVEVSDMLLALVPELRHMETGLRCNYTSWFSRGWCRAELWFHVLSNKRDKSVVVVHSTLETRFMIALDWQENLIVDGDFTVEGDRSVVASLGSRAIDCKLQHLAREGPLNLYRFFSSRRHTMLGLASPKVDAGDFVELFQFGSLEAAVKDASPMSALMCAALSGNAPMLQLLAALKGDVNARVHGMKKLGFMDGWTVLMAAVQAKQRGSLIATLIDLRADVHALAELGDNAVCHVKTPEQVRVLLEAKADFHTAHPPFCFTPLTACSGETDTETILALLAARCDPNPPLLAGLGCTPLIGVTLFARGSPHALGSVRALLEHRADPNATAKPFGSFYWLCCRARLEAAFLGLEQSSPNTRHWASMQGSTPLSFAASIGDEALTNLLLEAGADSRPNSRGDLPEDLARAYGHFQLLPMLSTFAA